MNFFILVLVAGIQMFLVLVVILKYWAIREDFISRIFSFPGYAVTRMRNKLNDNYLILHDTEHIQSIVFMV